MFLRRSIGTIVRRIRNTSQYKGFKVFLASVETIINFNGLQQLEGVLNILLFPLACCISFALMFNASYLGECFCNRDQKGKWVAIGLAILLHGVIAWIRMVTDASLILLFINLGFFVTVCIVSFLRSKNQDFHDKKKEEEKLEQEASQLHVKLQSIERERDFALQGHSNAAKYHALQEVEADKTAFQTGLQQAEDDKIQAHAYLTQRQRQIEDLKAKALSQLENHH